VDKPQRLKELFAGRHFDREVILLCVRRYLRFKLSLRDLVEMMAERGLSLAHTTIMRWVQHYTPEFEKRWHRHALAVPPQTIALDGYAASHRAVREAESRWFSTEGHQSAFVEIPQ
jgi:transposase-like protein